MLFTEAGLLGMLEESDYDSVDMVSPFLGSIIHPCRGEVDYAPVTTTFTNYVDV